MDQLYIKSSKGIPAVGGAIMGLPCGANLSDKFVNVRPAGGGVCESSSNTVPLLLVNATDRAIEHDFTEGDGPFAVMGAAVLTDNGATITSIQIIGEVYGFDGADEFLKFSTTSLASNADGSGNVTVGSTVFALAYDVETKTVTATKNGGGTIPKADAQSFLRIVQYRNDATPPDTTQRRLLFIVSDGTDNSLGSVVRINVEEA